MASREPLSRGDIMSRVGIERDVMTFWIRGGVLQPMAGPTGPGKHLRFAWYEANIAAIMNQLRILGVKIEGMLSIGRVYREAIAYFEKLDVTHSEILALMIINQLAAISSSKYINSCENTQTLGDNLGDLPDMLDDRAVSEFMGKLRKRVVLDQIIGLDLQDLSPKIMNIYLTVSHEELIRYITPYINVTNQPEKIHHEGRSFKEMTYFWRLGEGNDYRFAMGFEAAKLAHQDGAISLIAVDVIAAVHKVWNSSASKVDSE